MDRQSSAEVREYVITEDEKNAIIGKAVMNHKSAKRNLALLMEGAKHTAFALERLANALRELSAMEISDHLTVVTSMLRTERFDWSKVTPESLERLVLSLEDATLEVSRAAEKANELGI